MKNVIIKALRTITEIIISAFVIIGFITAYGAAILQESYKLQPLSAAEIAQAQEPAAGLLWAEDPGK